MFSYGVQAQAEPESKAEKLRLDVPLVSVRENAGAGFVPSMEQSLQLTKDLTCLAHAGMAEVLSWIPYPDGYPQWAIHVVDNVVIVALDASFVWSLPGQLPWLHEEWHRAVMSRRGSSSYNGVYDFDFGAKVIPGRSVQDADLIRLKAEQPAEMVRLSSAGFESQSALMLEFNRDRFFHGTEAKVISTQWLNLISSVAYWSVATAGGEGSMLDPNLLAFHAFEFVVGERENAEVWRWNAGFQHLPTPFGYAFHLNGSLPSPHHWEQPAPRA